MSFPSMVISIWCYDGTDEALAITDMSLSRIDHKR